VESAARLGPILEEALAHPDTAVIDCPVDYRENDRLLTL
jgi:thiamine pyrophosphate-dependent acetolactate synthase large subunit-like protein